MNGESKIDRMMNAVDGLDLTEGELGTLDWLSGWGGQTVENICTIIQKARESKTRWTNLRHKPCN